MKSAKWWLSGAIIALVVAAVGVYGPLRGATERRRNAAVARIRELASSGPTAVRGIGALQEPESRATTRPAKSSNNDWQAVIRRIAALYETSGIRPEIGAGATAYHELWWEHRTLSREEYADLEAYLDEVRDMHRQVHLLGQLAGQAFNYEDYEKFRKQEEHIFSILNTARSVNLADAYVQGRRGLGPLAFDDLTAALRLANLFATSPDPNARFSLCISYRELFYVFQEVVGSGCLSIEQIDALLSLVPADCGRDLFVRSLVADTSARIDDFEGLGAGKRMAGGGAFWKWVDRAYGSVIARPALNLDECAYAEMMVRIIGLASRPYYQVKPDLAQCDRAVASMPLQPYTRMIIQPPSWLLVDQIIYEATLDLMRIGLVAQRYRIKHGEYPRSLDVVSQEMGSAMPVDPFTGHDYVYRVSGDVVLLYSAGYNGRDDGGENDTATLGFNFLYTRGYYQARTGEEGYVSADGDPAKDDIVWRNGE